MYPEQFYHHWPVWEFGLLSLRKCSQKNLKSEKSEILQISSQVSNYDGAVLEIYLDRKFQWPQEGLNSESLAYEVVI